MSYNHAMFKQATVQDISNQRVTKLHGHVIVITRHYPRFLKRNLLHDYVPLLAPPLSLLKEFKAAEAAMGDHDGAFESIAYESKFSIGESGLAALSELANESQTRSIYLVCHCAIGQRCHRELILLLARDLFGAKISKLSFSWAVFSSRIAAGEFSK